MDYVSGKEPTDGFTQRLNDEIEKLIELIIRRIKKDKPVEVIADELEEDFDTVKRIYDIAIKHAPEFDVDAIYEELNK